MKSRSIKFVCGLAAAAMASNAAAQSINPALDPYQTETRILGALTIPLGASTDRRQTAPRMEIITRTRTSDVKSSVIARDESRRWQERRIGLTLDGRDTMMFNGRPLEAPENQSHLNTGETVLVVLGVVVLAGGITVLAVRDAVLDDD